MMDKNDPKTWKKFHSNLCNSCVATCCTMPLEVEREDLIRLGWIMESDSNKNVVKFLIKQKRIDRYRDKTEKFTIARRSDGSCHLLDANGLCSVYEIRPKPCREFPHKSSRPGYCPYIQI